jgi:hypothetical protein
VPGTNHHAVGRIPCTLDGQPEVKDCEFVREDDSTRVKVYGMDENCVIPDAVITGDEAVFQLFANRIAPWPRCWEAANIAMGRMPRQRKRRLT